MARVLITGADGFTGRYLAAALAAQGDEVHGLVRAQAASLTVPGCAALHVCELLDAAAVAELTAALAPEWVAHLAAVAFVGHGQVEDFYRVNIAGTRNLLAGLAALEAPPAAVLLASSANVYGNATEGVIDESTPLAPANDYAVSKLAMEYMAATWQDRLPITVVRPFNYTGVGQSEKFLLPKIVGHVRRRAPVLELGNLDVERDFSDVRTVVQVYRKLLVANAAGRVLNVCSGRAYSLRGVIDMASAIGGHRPEIRVNAAFVRSNEVRRLLGSRQALESCIGRVEDRPLEDTLHWMLEA